MGLAIRGWPMNHEGRLKERIAEAVSDFHRDLMSVTLGEMLVDLHPNSVVVTIRGASCQAEKDLAHDDRARELLERLHRRVFEVSRSALETAIERIVGRPVERLRLSVDPETGDRVLFCALSLRPVHKGESISSTKE